MARAFFVSIWRRPRRHDPRIPVRAHPNAYFPIAYLTLRPILAAIDSNIEGTALSLGASRARAFRTEKRWAWRLAREAGARFVKSSTGVHADGGGATDADVCVCCAKP